MSQSIHPSLPPLANGRPALSLACIRDRVQEIRATAQAGDTGTADALERSLLIDVLADIREGHPLSPQLAAIALESVAEMFERPLLTFARLPDRKRDQLLRTLSLPERERNAILARLD